MSDPRTTSSIFTRGAVDLSALRTPAPAPSPTADDASAPASPAAGGGGGLAVIDVTEATFQSEVLERSLTTPVVIDFWADWCQPCKQLSPVLERLATEGGGSWILAKIDIDANPRLAQAFRIQSIPHVFAVIAGQPAELFAGVLPEAQLRQAIDAVLKAAGVQGGAPVPEDQRLVEADDALMSGDLDRAEQAYKKILAEAPADRSAEAGLAQVGLLRRITGANAPAVLATAQNNPDDVPAQLLAADVEVASGQAERGYQRLVDLIRRTSGDEREEVRKHLVSLFTVAGPDDPAVAAARRALATALF
ncbi:tetratricopeptide repeat protein [Actinomycetes bacterium KLBMP 9797]